MVRKNWLTKLKKTIKTLAVTVNTRTQIVKKTPKLKLKSVMNVKAKVVVMNIKEAKSLIVCELLESTIYITSSQVTIVKTLVSTLTK